MFEKIIFVKRVGSVPYPYKVESQRIDFGKRGEKIFIMPLGKGNRLLRNRSQEYQEVTLPEELLALIPAKSARRIENACLKEFGVVDKPKPKLEPPVDVKVEPKVKPNVVERHASGIPMHVLSTKEELEDIHTPPEDEPVVDIHTPPEPEKDVDWVAELAKRCDAGEITQRGSWYFIKDTDLKFQGRDDVILFIKDTMGK